MKSLVGDKEDDLTEPLETPAGPSMVAAKRTRQRWLKRFFTRVLFGIAIYLFLPLVGEIRLAVEFAELVDEKLKGGEQVTWQSRMAAEQDNLRAALEWGMNRNPDGALRIAGAANLFWTASGYSAEGFRWAQKALEQVNQAPLPSGTNAEQRLVARARALRGLTRLYLSHGDNLNARQAGEESVALYRQSQDRRGLAFALVVLAYPLEFLGQRVQAEEVLHESYSIAQAEGDVYGICRSLNRLALVIVQLYHDPDLAQQYVEQSLRMAREASLRSQEAQACEMLGFIASAHVEIGSIIK